MPLDRTFLGLKDSKYRGYSLYFKLHIALGEEARLSQTSLQALWELESSRAGLSGFPHGGEGLRPMFRTG